MNPIIYPGLGNLMELSDVQTRSVTAENVYGEKGRGGMALVSDQPQEETLKIGQLWTVNTPARDLGPKFKARPAISLAARLETTIMDISGPGTLQHIWITVNEKVHRNLILRMYWDGEEAPSVEAPLGDFFCTSWKTATPILALPINVNSRNGFNSYFPMPFRKRARVTIENRTVEKVEGFFYTINYALAPVSDTSAYFHAQFRRTNPLPYKEDYVILDGVNGKGHYVGTFMAWQQNSTGWWGEGEIKVFLDGDEEYPTLCGTGTEDYFGGAWCFGENYTAPFFGYPLGDNQQRPGGRHTLYRFHVMDPIRFHQDIKVTMQALGWRDGGRYLPLQDDIASVAYWYQTEPHAPFPILGNNDALEII